jgi:hypothetical protein
MVTRNWHEPRYKETYIVGETRNLEGGSITAAGPEK